MEHPTLTPHERKIVNENVGRFGAQMLRQRVDESRWPAVTLALIVELAGQVLRMAEGTELRDTERPPALCDQQGGFFTPELGHHQGTCCYAVGHEGRHSWEPAE